MKNVWYTEVFSLGVNTEKSASKLLIIVNTYKKHSKKVNSPLLLLFPFYILPDTCFICPSWGWIKY